VSYAEQRRVYEFPYAVKHEALETTLKCEVCGEEETDDNPFECNHRIAIWFAIENPCLIPDVIRSISNLQIVHKKCHLELHQKESRAYYENIAPVVLYDYLEHIVDKHKDDWRNHANVIS
jgi:hypothetical protein